MTITPNISANRPIASASSVRSASFSIVLDCTMASPRRRPGPNPATMNLDPGLRRDDGSCANARSQRLQALERAFTPACLEFRRHDLDHRIAKGCDLRL